MQRGIKKMYLRRLIGVLIWLCAGLGVAAGTFAFFLVIRILPRMIQKTKLSDKVISVENTVVRGIMFGTILSFGEWKGGWMEWIFGSTLLSIYGVCAGIFSGGIAVALAEILDVFPIFFRRLGLNEDRAEPLLFVMALGKIAGSLFYFLTGYGIIGE